MSAFPRTARSSISRRDILLMALSSAAVGVVPAVARAAASAAAPDARFSTLLAGFADEILVLSPPTATGLGLDTGARAPLKALLEDGSPVGDARWSAQMASMAKRLAALDRSQLGPDAQIRYDTVLYAVNAGIEGTRFSYGGGAEAGFFGGTSPYPVSQQSGILTSIPEFLDSQHQIQDSADAEAYLARVAAMDVALDQESARITAQAAQGVAPPDFIARTALGQLQAYRATPVDAQKLVTSITERTAKLGIAGNWHDRAVKLVTDAVYPALERQIAAFQQSTAKATDVAGVYRLPDGDAYYQWALKLGTTTTHGAAEIHRIGMEQNSLLQARIDGLLRTQGLTQGSVGQRLQALSKDPNRFYADDDRGRAQLIAYCNERVAQIRKLMPQLSHLNLKAPLLIKRVPTDIEAGAALGYMNFASLDGKRPAIYYVNLKSTKLWPKSELSTLTAHEGIPGHAWQGAYIAEHQGEIPLIASMIGFNAFVEGWALYAEQLVDEFGLYAGDPFSQIGYLQAQQFRACRLVVDTGIHSLRWTRQQAIRFLVENTGRGEAAMTSEVDRYCVSPGQACGYKMGHNEILLQRARAKTALGAKFDLAAFNDAIVKSTGVPLTVLPSVIDRYLKGAGV